MVILGTGRFKQHVSVCVLRVKEEIAELVERGILKETMHVKISQNCFGH